MPRAALLLSFAPSLRPDPRRTKPGDWPFLRSSSPRCSAASASPRWACFKSRFLEVPRRRRAEVAAEGVDEGAGALVAQGEGHLRDRAPLRQELEGAHQTQLGAPGAEGEPRLAPEGARERARARARGPGPGGERAHVGGIAL